MEEGAEKGMAENYLKVQLDAHGFDLQPNDWVAVRVDAVDSEDTHGAVTSIILPAPPSLALCGF